MKRTVSAVRGISNFQPVMVTQTMLTGHVKDLFENLVGGKKPFRVGLSLFFQKEEEEEGESDSEMGKADRTVGGQDLVKGEPTKGDNLKVSLPASIVNDDSENEANDEEIGVTGDLGSGLKRARSATDFDDLDITHKMARTSQ